LPAPALREVQVWLERTRHHLVGMRRDFDALSPWGALAAAPLAGREDDARRIGKLLLPDRAFADIDNACLQARVLLAEWAASEEEPDARRWTADMARALVRGLEAPRLLRDRLEEAASRAAALAHDMDFRF